MRHVLVNLALMGFLCRALVPAGFMPAPISDGGPIRFCHGDPAGALLTALVAQRESAGAEPALTQHGATKHGVTKHGVDAGPHLLAGDHPAEHRDAPEQSANHEGGHDHDHEQGANHEGWDRCPVGTAFAFAVLSSDFTLPLLPLEHDLQRSDADRPIQQVLPTHYQARAPPRV